VGDIRTTSRLRGRGAGVRRVVAAGSMPPSVLARAAERGTQAWRRTVANDVDLMHGWRTNRGSGGTDGRA
jgi:hypothetical protein